jgi:hypothetical protein
MLLQRPEQRRACWLQPRRGVPLLQGLHRGVFVQVGCVERLVIRWNELAAQVALAAQVRSLQVGPDMSHVSQALLLREATPTPHLTTPLRVLRLARQSSSRDEPP